MIDMSVILFWLPLEAPTPNGPEAQPDEEEDAADKQEEGSEEEWEQVGPRNKTSITRQADFVSTPITDIFGGHIRYDNGVYKLRISKLVCASLWNRWGCRQPKWHPLYVGLARGRMPSDGWSPTIWIWLSAMTSQERNWIPMMSLNMTRLKSVFSQNCKI